jgi:hypothetical protein
VTRVRITIEDELLGDVEVEQDDRVSSFQADRQRRVIQQLMSEAIAKINGAYGLGSKPTKEHTS